VPYGLIRWTCRAVRTLHSVHFGESGWCYWYIMVCQLMLPVMIVADNGCPYSISGVPAYVPLHK
jgi:hypothetical protein